MEILSKFLKVLFGVLLCWGAVFFISFYTAFDTIGMKERIAYSGILTVIGVAGYYFKVSGTKTTKNVSKQKRYSNESGRNTKNTVRYILEGEFGNKPIYRIENNKIYTGLSNKYNYEIRGNKIYKALSSQWIFRIEGNRIYKGFDNKVAYKIEKNKVYKGEFGHRPIYRISSSWKG